MVFKIAFIFTLACEVFLSHQTGKKSGAESHALSAALHVNEKKLRTSAHVILFALLAFFAVAAFTSYWALIGVLCWAFIDEATKPWIKGRHFSWADFGWNSLGMLLGAGLALLLI